MSRYRVWHAAGMSDEAGIGYLAVKGPRVNEFAVAEELARIAQRAINHHDLTPRQRKVVRASLHASLAGDWSDGDLCWSQADADAALAALERI